MDKVSKQPVHGNVDVRCSSKTDNVVKLYRQELTKVRMMVNTFLKENEFEEGKPNSKRSSWFSTTYPLHEAVKQNDAYIASKLLLFGADPYLQNMWGYNAFDYAFGRRAHPSIVQLFDQHLKKTFAPQPSSQWKHRLQYCPPPRGFEEFFANLEKDPLVEVPSCENSWLLHLGKKSLRDSGDSNRMTWVTLDDFDINLMMFFSPIKS